MDNLFHLLTELAINPGRQAEFIKSPTAVMDAAGLSETERAVLQRRKTAEITAAFADELTVLAIAFREPDPDPTPDPEPWPDPEPTPDPEASGQN